MRRHSSRLPASRPAAEPASDGGFTLLEVVISIAVIGIVMTALATFFMTSVSAANQQVGRQTAIQVADDGVELVRAVKGSAAAAGRDKASSDAQWGSPVAGVATYLSDMQEAWDSTASYPGGASATLPTTARVVTINGVAYGQNFYVGTCWQAPAGGTCGATKITGYVEFYRVVVAVTWRERHCAAGVCSYVTSTLVSDAGTEPVFNANQSAQPPAVDNPGAQFGEVSVPTTMQVTATGGAPPVTWSAVGLPPGLTMASSGLISGTPTIAGSFPVTVTTTDGFGLVGSAVFTWTVNPAPQLTGPASQTTSAGVGVSLAIASTGGTGPYTWSATGLPLGLAIDPTTGVVTGLPTLAGPAKSVTVTLTDSYGKSDSATFNWTILVAPTIISPLGNRTGTVGNIVLLPAAALLGTGPYTWTAQNLPTGLTMTSAGLISGTLNAGSRYVVTVKVTDSVGGTSSVSFVWTVSATSPTLRVTAPTGDRTADAVGQTVSFTAAASGGNASVYTWTATGLPPGMSISSGGTVSGKLTTAGNYTVALVVKDSKGATATFMFTWTVA